MSSAEVKSPTEPKLKAQTASDHRSGKKSSSNATLFANILIIVAIGTVVYASQLYKDELEKTRLVLESQATASLSQEPIKTAQTKKNVMCPQAKADLESCLEKKQRCKKTEKQFASAQKQFTKLISDCARSNEQNERINDQMQKEIKQMEDDLTQAEKP